MAIRSMFKKNKNPEAHEDKRHEHDAPHPHVEEGEGNWLVSYADMMTLLCGFFIMMFSMANLEKDKFDKFREEVAKTFKGEYTNPSTDIQKELSQVIQDQGIENETILTQDSTGVSVTFESAVFFITGSADVSDRGKTILDKLIAAIIKIQAKKSLQYNIVVEGHTDHRPVVSGVYPSNWELSSARASRVIRHFIDHSFNPARMLAIGYADTRPKHADRQPSGEWNEESMAKNRRVVIRVIHPEIKAIPFDGLITKTEERAPSAAPTNSTGQNVPVEKVVPHPAH